MFGLWDDLKIYIGTAQTIYYAVNGATPNRITTFEFYESNFGSSVQYYHFQIIFYENLPNIVKLFYFEMSDGGVGATIGLQRKLTHDYCRRVPKVICCRFIKWTKYDLFGESTQCSGIQYKYCI